MARRKARRGQTHCVQFVGKKARPNTNLATLVASEETTATSYWMENAMQPGRHVLVDCGTWSEPTTQERFKRLRERVALRNCERVGNDRQVVRLPPKMAHKVLAYMPEIQPGAASYCWCTHGFRGA